MSDGDGYYIAGSDLPNDYAAKCRNFQMTSGPPWARYQADH